MEVITDPALHLCFVKVTKGNDAMEGRSQMESAFILLDTILQICSY